MTRVELDPALAQRARVALTAAGYRPTLVTGDGGPDIHRTRGITE
ncbi:MAG: hypothetical protein ACRDQU_08550 [Pseudonocardiaceae bacterium]